MTIRERVMAALGGISVPVYFGGYAPDETGSPPPDKYIVFTTMSRPGDYADNRRKSWRHYVYLNLWAARAAGAYAQERGSVLAAMENAGFAATDVTEDYEEDSRMNRCAFTFFLLEVS